jgi:hypothetical protein
MPEVQMQPDSIETELVAPGIWSRTLKYRFADYEPWCDHSARKLVGEAVPGTVRVPLAYARLHDVPTEPGSLCRRCLFVGIRAAHRSQDDQPQLPSVVCDTTFR